jgi:hypothetical protein
MSIEFNGPSLAVPVREYSQPGTATIAVVGMVHWADPDFYNKALNYVEHRESLGSIIHYELVDQPNPQETIPEADLDVLLKLGMFGLAAANPAVVNFPPRNHWENHDVTLIGLAESLDRRAVAFSVVSSLATAVKAAFPRHPGNSARRELINTLNKALRISAGLEEKNPVLDWLDGNTETAIIHKRNEVALRAIDRHVKKRAQVPLTLTWGAAHLAGIGRGLEGRGYQLASEMPLTAIAA